ncbi:CpaF family protein [Streptacidiphilus sp. P02-A3a]|uniref:CpaF family protein n=1 Tax=Streptacidiphilus sp. P02-A3a TaxID=2704468 RepID=UPI0015FC8832|nr:CpaF/VirB11 family protein [Streptacidiphilus sp. P02-A3a]QMU68871.1 CpaF family protein [Streptacidiphilus sp. P02-A3a]
MRANHLPLAPITLPPVQQPEQSVPQQPQPQQQQPQPGGRHAGTAAPPPGYGTPPPGYGTPPSSRLLAAPLARTQPQSRPPQPQSPVDYAAVRQVRKLVQDELHEQSAGDTPGDQESRRQRGRAVIESVVARWSDVYAQTHGLSPTREMDRALADAVFDLMFRAGRLQPYLDDELVEDIYINGCDNVSVLRVNEPLRQVPPIADSDEELVELLQDLARRHGGGERSLSTSSPNLAMRLDGGMRVQVMTGVTPRPFVTIRRHRVASATLGDLVRLGSVDSTLAAFLSASVRARKHILVTGVQRAGKTSLLRALAAEIPADERVATMESEYELWLHTLGHLRQVVPIEERQGNGERIDGRPSGELTLTELMPAALRMSLSRIIVGEVRSREVMPMLQAMTNGVGGMATMHAQTPYMVPDRVAQLCAEYGANINDGLAYRLLANGVHLIVHVSLVDETPIGGRVHRFVSHVLELTGIGENGRPSVNTVFGPHQSGVEPRAVPNTPPACLDDLRRVGFDPALLDNPYGTWGRPLDLRVTGNGARR